MRCPLLYKFRAVDRLPEPPSEHALKGTIVHKTLELLLRKPRDDRGEDAAYVCLERAIELHGSQLEELYGALWSSEAARSPEDGRSPAGAYEEFLERVRHDCWRFVSNYLAQEDPRAVDALALEKRIQLPLHYTNGAREDKRITLVGVVDRLDRAPDGRVVVVDYKTGKAPGRGYEREALFGVMFYALVLTRLWEAPGETEFSPPSLVRLMYLQDGTVIEDEVRENTLVFTETKIKGVAEAIFRAHSGDDWRPKPGPLCDFCHFKPICPAHA